MYKHSEACCTRPLAAAEDYKPKGTYTTIGGLKTYVTGPSNADRAILCFYDVFGGRPQIVQGMDILAYSDSEHPFQVYMPDFWEGSPAQMDWLPPTTPDKEALFGKFLEGAAPPNHLPKVKGIIADAEKANPNIKKWGCIGYCWGGKMVSILGGIDPTFKAGVQTSPAFVDAADAEKVQMPMCMLASNEEPADEVKKYEEKLKVPNNIVTFPDSAHGFMSARADFTDKAQKEAYEKGYEMSLKFFNDHL